MVWFNGQYTNSQYSIIKVCQKPKVKGSKTYNFKIDWFDEPLESILKKALWYDVPLHPMKEFYTQETFFMGKKDFFQLDVTLAAMRLLLACSFCTCIKNAIEKFELNL